MKDEELEKCHKEKTRATLTMVEMRAHLEQITSENDSNKEKLRAFQPVCGIMKQENSDAKHKIKQLEEYTDSFESAKTACELINRNLSVENENHLALLKEYEEQNSKYRQEVSQLQIGLNLNEKKYEVLSGEFHKQNTELTETTKVYNSLKVHSEEEEEKLTKEATEWRLKYRSTQCAQELQQS